MALMQVKLENLHLFDDGRVAAAFDAGLEKLVADCVDRPHVPGARVLKLLVTVKPDPQSGESCDDVSLTFQLNDGLPARSSRSFGCGVRKARAGSKQLMLVWNDLAPDDPAQMTIDDAGAGAQGGA